MNFIQCHSQQIGDSLFTFGFDQPLAVTKYENLRDEVVKTQLTPGNRSLWYFALAFYRSTDIYLSGGRNATSQRFTEVLKYTIETDTWALAPSLNKARECHGSCALGSKIFVLGGFFSTGKPEKSVKCLDPSASQPSWREIVLAKLTPKAHPVMYPIR